MKKLLLIPALLLAAGTAQALHIGYVMPAGSQRGTEVELTFGGQKFGGLNGAYVSGSGVTVEYVEHVRHVPHPDGRQRRYIEKSLRQLHRGDPRKIPLPESTEGWRWHPYYDRLAELSDNERDILYRFLFVRKNSLQDSPAIRGRVLVRLRIAPDAELGEREIRLLAGGRVSNPLKFFISDAPERRDPYFVIPPGKTHTPHVDIPSVLNGQIYPGETDYFTFEAEKGQQYTFSAKARYLMPFIGDGVPGHFQMVMEVVDASGKSVAYGDDNYFDPDPLLTFTAPADGKYTLVVRDALYRGREDFVYRIEAYKGAPRKVKFPDPPLQKFLVMKDVAGKILAKPLMIQDNLKNSGGNSYRFRAEKGEVVMLEVYSRRLGLPPDAVLKVFDSKGKLLAANDDVPRLKAGLILHGAADPVIRFTAPAKGVYTVNVSDVTGAYGENYGYYLRIDRPRAHFAAYGVPSAVMVSPGGTGTMEVIVERYDGFDGEIKLHLDSESFKIIGANTIPAGCSRTTITIFAPGWDRSLQPQEVRLTASNGEFVTKVIPGDEMMQAFAYTHIAPAQKMLMSRFWKGQPLSRFNWAGKVNTVKLDRPVTLTVDVNTRRINKDCRVELQMVNPPEWLKALPGKDHIAEPGTIKPSGKGRKNMIPHKLHMTLQADAGSKGKVVNQLFKIVYTFPRTDKNGKVITITQKTILPVIRIEGSSL